MRQQRVRMDQFDRGALLQHHQQAVSHALAPHQSQRQLPCQLVFPDDTMAIGSPPVSRGPLFPADRESVPDSAEERQRQLLQNEPIVVYTTLSDRRLLEPEIAWRGVAMLLLAALQCVCIVVILTGGTWHQFAGRDLTVTPSGWQIALYSIQLALHVWFLLAMYLWSADMLKVHGALLTAVLILVLALAASGLLDIVACVLGAPMLYLSNSIKDLMMPHCFTIRK
eukprot:TRINITY_DN23955_c0_g1_i1.p1 TRINITY_DN23955_c0_g1~~TRINITY_DN23955_c0_g1_i1.p1  ORF type:complete len:251 (+),score=41.05 TRINITY_DN23955_c0_g1_i1:79-753(+)